MTAKNPCGLRWCEPGNRCSECYDPAEPYADPAEEVAALKAANRQLVEALDGMLTAFDCVSPDRPPTTFGPVVRARFAVKTARKVPHD